MGEKTENLLAESHGYFARIIDIIGDPVFVKDGQCRFVLINNALEKLLGKSQEDMVGKTGGEFLLQEEMDHFRAVDNRVLSTGEEDLCEEKLTVGSGDVRTILTRKTRYTNPQGENFIVGVIRDITARKKAEEEKDMLHAQLIHSEKMAGIGTLAAGVAHEFNNMLQIIQGYAESAKQGMGTAEAEEDVDIVLKTANDAKKIVKDLLSFSKIKPGQEKTFSVTQSMDNVLRVLGYQLTNSGIKVHRDFHAHPVVGADKAEMENVFFNLILNARDSLSPAGGNLTVSVKQEGAFAEMNFSDEGQGIKKEHVGKIFEPFFTTKGPLGGSSVPGTGLGLYVVYNTIEKSGGTIKCQSDEGQGTTFTIRMPLSTKASEETVGVAGGKESPQPELKAQRILVLDDEPQSAG